MIVIVDSRQMVTSAYLSSFGREGVAAVGFGADEFEGWVESAADEDVRSIEAVLLGEYEGARSLARIIKRRSAAAIIAMKEQKTLSTTLDLFADGVDDVVGKPCHVREILARIEAISRRARENAASGLEVGAIRIFRDGREPLLNGEPVSLPRRELRILEFLVVNQGRRITKAQIYSAVYGLFDQQIEESVIESHISKLRKRLRSALGYDPIESRRHLGYRLVCRTAQE